MEIPDLEMSSVLDLYTRVAHRGKNDERNEFDKVVQEFGRRGYRLPEDGKVAKRIREALQLYEKNPEKGMPMEYRVVPATPITPGVVITEVSEAEEREEDPGQCNSCSPSPYCCRCARSADRSKPCATPSLAEDLSTGLWPGQSNLAQEDRRCRPVAAFEKVGGWARLLTWRNLFCIVLHSTIILCLIRFSPNRNCWGSEFVTFVFHCIVLQYNYPAPI